MGSPFGNIEVRGARANNLKNIALEIPRRQIVVFTGASGSGKSSLVFDTIAAESQRLINETFATFVQLFLPRYGQPDADAPHCTVPSVGRLVRLAVRSLQRVSKNDEVQARRKHTSPTITV